MPTFLERIWKKSSSPKCDLTQMTSLSIQIEMQAFAMGTNFEGANLANSILDRADFSNANLKNANLTNSVITGANFNEANLENTNFEDALIGMPLRLRLTPGRTMISRR